MKIIAKLLFWTNFLKNLTKKYFILYLFTFWYPTQIKSQVMNKVIW